jgi:hypothetical protein
LNWKGTGAATIRPVDETGMEMNIEWNGVEYIRIVIE